MKNVSVLDCTLRDGGRIINCEFYDGHTKDIASRLAKAKIDIVELGFLRDAKKVNYTGNSTFFTDVDQIRPFVDKSCPDTIFVAFIDYGMFDFDTLKEYDGSSIDGIRVGFTKPNFENDLDDVIRCLKIVKQRGYRLFIQGVNSLGYTDAELLKIVDMVNSIKPYSFGIVDTYGGMYSDDVQHIFDLINHNMDKDICIDFHSHNNFQLSFALSQQAVHMGEQAGRHIIIDSSLNGMGKCAGNLNTELIVDYLVRKKHLDYDFDAILDIIDDYIYSLKQEHEWGYSIPSVMAGIYKVHPNNVIYLTEKFRLATKDIKNIMFMIDPALRHHYDYDNIQRLYREYNNRNIDDKQTLEQLKNQLRGRNVLVVLPGSSIVERRADIENYVAQNNCFVISVNHISDFGDKQSRFAFFGSAKRYERFAAKRAGETSVIVSNIDSDSDSDIAVNYEGLIEREYEDFDNSAIMLLNLLRKLGIRSFAFAGFDGFDVHKSNYYNNEDFEQGRFRDKFEQTNANMRRMLENYAVGLDDKKDVTFITDSIYSDIFRN